jgi:cobalt-zinc-cadmium resistance protein CzcA
MSIAQQMNPTVQAARSAEAGSQKLRRTGFELPNTEVQYMQGQFNSYIRDDNNITIQQRIPFPTAVAARSGLVKAEAESSTTQRQVAEADLRYEVAALYHQLQYLHAIEALVAQEDSTYSELARVAELRHDTGEGSMLQRTTAVVRIGEIRDKHRRLLADITVAQQRLAARLGMSTLVDVVQEEILPLPTPDLSGDPMLTSPDLRRLDQDLEVAHQRKRVESNALLPDLMVGYFNQTLIGGPTSPEVAPLAVRSDRFEGFLAGVSVPLWFVPQAARSKAAGYQEEAARYTLEAAQLQFRTEMEETRRRLEQDKATLLRYTNDALPNAERILLTSHAAFSAGEIGQAEHVLNVQQAIEIRQEHLRVLYDHNATILRLQRLIAAP